EMLLRGTIHGYYRMYWGKKIIEWSPTCQDALETMVHIHDRWALDGRDPNTYTNRNTSGKVVNSRIFC
ncbi:MAG: hypothetical protein QXQ99_01420, partial [Nitrososphaerota archaeon]